jgi:hypothetical protein
MSDKMDEINTKAWMLGNDPETIAKHILKLERQLAEAVEGLERALRGNCHINCQVEIHNTLTRIKEMT